MRARTFYPYKGALIKVQPEYIAKNKKIVMFNRNTLPRTKGLKEKLHNPYRS